MCIIIAKKKGIDLPGKDIIKRCWDRNPQGAGLCYERDGEVHIEKGFMQFEELDSRLEALGEEINIRESSLIIHFRIATSGRTDEGNCHPFPVTDDAEAIRAKSATADLAMAHNGVIMDFSEPRSKYSDTQHFIMKVVMPLYNMNSKHDFYREEKIRYLLSKSVNGSRLVFMNGDGEIYTIGKWIEDDGILYSNDGYRGMRKMKTGKRAKLSDINGNVEWYVDGRKCSRSYFFEFLNSLKRLEEDAYDAWGNEVWSPLDGESYYVDEWRHEIYMVDIHGNEWDLMMLGQYI